MKRFCRSSWRLGLLCQKYATTPVFQTSKPMPPPDPLDDLFSELEEVETSGGVGKKNRATVAFGGKTPMKPSVPGPIETDGEQLLEVNSARATKAALQRALDEAKEEERELAKENARERHTRELEGYRPTAPARGFLSTGEMIADKAPQHFVSAKEELTDVPCLTNSGSVAVVSLVGKVVRSGPQLGDSASSGSVEGEEPAFDLGVEYAVPFMTARKSEVLVRCVGTALATFAKERVHVGDIVHVLGHLVPITEDGKPCSQVYALPHGGNLSVVARFVS